MAKIKGLGLENEIVGDELHVYHRNQMVCFQWPLTFDWSLKMLRWQARKRLGLLHPELRPPALCDSYGGIEQYVSS